MSFKKSYAGCLELLGNYDKSGDFGETGWAGLMPEAPGSTSDVLSSGPHPIPEPPDDETGPGGG